MLDIKPNHFYKSESAYFIIFQTKEQLIEAFRRADILWKLQSSPIGLADTVFVSNNIRIILYYEDFIGRELNCGVTHSEINVPFLVLETVDSKFIKGYFKNKVGWIVYESWLNCLEEASSE